MKKTISILLVVAMLMSMLVVTAVPASANGSTAGATGGNASVITGGKDATGVVNEATGANAATAGNKMTAGDATRAAELAAAGYTALNQENIGSMVDNGKYYLTENITLSAPLATRSGVTLDGNGYTVNLSMSLFHETTNLTIKNITLTGTIGMDCTSALNRYIPKGYTVIENLTSSVNVTYDSGKHPWTPAGVIYSTGAGSSLTNVLYNGTITVQGAADVTKALSGAAGMVGMASGTTFDNCISAGVINITATGAFTGTGTGDSGVGGIAGKATGSCTFKNCTNNTNITMSAKADTNCRSLGGIAGFSNKGTTYTNCINNGNITLNSTATDWNVGGITGHVWEGASFDRCTNNGDITSAAALHEGAAGILGYSNTAASSFINCRNTGDISASGASVAGIVGRATGTGVTASNCENTGNMHTSFTAGGFGGYLSNLLSADNFINGVSNDDTKGKITHDSGDIYIGGFCGAIDNAVSIKNVVNHGDLVGNKTTFMGGIGGFIRGTGTFENVTNNGDVTHTGWGKHHPAGVVDELKASKINNVVNNGRLLIEDCDGTAGVIGVTTATDIQNVLNTGSVKQTKNANFTAGVFGTIPGSSVLKNVINQGNVTATYNYSGWIRVSGITNSAPAKFDSCENTGTITYTGNSTGTFVSGFNAISYSAVQYVNCTNAGQIIVNSDSTGYYGIGGFRGWTNGSTTYTNCVAKADITVTGTLNSGNDLAVGGFTGHSDSAITINSCTASADATITLNTTGANAAAGGFAGQTPASISNSNNYSTVTVTAGSVADLGGFIGRPGGVVASNCKNYGHVYAVGSDVHIGGFFGLAKGSLTLTDCTNYGKLDNYGAAAVNGSVGGIVGTYYSNNESVFTRCTNNSELLSMSVANYINSKGELTSYDNNGIGGLVGRAEGQSTHYGNSSIVFNSCINNGNITRASTTDGKDATDSNKALNSNISAGGFMGQLSAMHNVEFYYCINYGNVTKGEYDKEGGHIGAAGFVGTQRVGGYSWTPWECSITAENCINIGNMNDVSDAAGFIGKSGEMNADYSHTVTVKNFVNEGTITAPWSAGVASYGASDANVSYVISDSLNVGKVVGSQTNGGITGLVSGGSVAVTNSFNNGMIEGVSVSGIVGGGNNVTVENCYSAGSLSGSRVYPISGANGSFDGNLYTSNAYGGADSKGDLVTMRDIEDAIVEILMTAGYGFDSLETLINEAELVDPETADDYSTYTWEQYSAALEAAKALQGRDAMTFNPDGTVTIITQGQVCKAYNDLRYALDTLILKSEMKLFLQYTINKAEKYLGTTDVYTADSWANYLEALNEAKAIEAAGSHDEVDLMLYVNNLNAAVEALVLGGNIVTGDDFAMLNGQKGTFYLMSDITITAPVESFSGILYGNGHTITVSGCGLFLGLIDATVQDITVVGDAGDADSLFGSVDGDVVLSNLTVKTPKLGVAALISSGTSGADVVINNVFSTAAAENAALVANVAGLVEITGALVMADAPALVAKTSNAGLYSAYLDGVEFYNADGVCLDEEDVFASGQVAYDINEALGATLLVQVLGRDALPVLGAPAVDGINVVVKDGDGYKNAGTKYDSGIGVVPPMPEITPADPVYGSLRSAIERADALNAADYTEATWEVVKTALEVAKKALWATVQSEIDAATNALNIAVAGLKKVGSDGGADATVDYTKLDAAIAAAEALKGSDYTDGSWSMLQAMLEMAKAAKTATSQATVDSAVSALVSATVNLTKVKVEADAPATDAPNTDATEPATDDGCGGVVGGAAVVLAAVIALGAGISFKKKED